MCHSRHGTTWLVRVSEVISLKPMMYCAKKTFTHAQTHSFSSSHSHTHNKEDTLWSLMCSRLLRLSGVQIRVIICFRWKLWWCHSCRATMNPDQGSLSVPRAALSLFQWFWPLPNYNLDHFCKFLYMTTVCTRKVRRLRRKTRSQESPKKTEWLKRCKTAAPRWLQYKYKRQYKVWQLRGQDDRGV